MKTFYRVANSETNQGLWYDRQGNFTGLIHDKFNFCKNRDLQMPFDKDIVGWLSATDDLESLWHWFSKEDIENLEKHGYFITSYTSSSYRYHNNHWVICEKTSLIKKTIPLNSLSIIMKGAFKGNCNRTACQKPNAVYFNYSTKLYYCASCANLINSANRQDSKRLFGHDLCLRHETDINLIPECEK